MLCFPLRAPLTLCFNVFVSLTRHDRYHAGVNYSSNRFPNTPYILKLPLQFSSGKPFLLPGVPFLSHFQSGQLPTHPARRSSNGSSNATLYVSLPAHPRRLHPRFPEIPSHSNDRTALQRRLSLSSPFQAGTKSCHLSLPMWPPPSLLGNDSHPRRLALGH